MLTDTHTRISTPSYPPLDVITQALHTATKLIANNTACRDAFASLTITAPIGQIPIIQAVLRVSLYGAEGYGRAAAREVLRSYCVGNREGQLALVSTMVPLGDDAGGWWWCVVYCHACMAVMYVCLLSVVYTDINTQIDTHTHTHTHTYT